MSSTQLIQVFEHQKLLCYPQSPLQKKDWEALIRFNERHKNRYFEVIHKGVRFKQYVGVIQVGQLTIEILPKADASPASGDHLAKTKWRRVLIEMLRTCHLLNLENVDTASLKLSTHSLLDLYLEVFLSDLKQLIRRGLVKQYRNLEGNRTALKGRLRFAPHLRKNSVHQERFYVQYQTYDRAHLLHILLYKALNLIPQITTNPHLHDSARQLRLDFPPMPDLSVTTAIFDQVKLNRKTQAYQKVLALARLILLRLSPNLQSGCSSLPALLFDMNALFEEYIYRQLHKTAQQELFKIFYQPSQKFWKPNQGLARRLRPDLILQTTNQKIILDTKWKVISKINPSMDDLRQMYTYHHFFEAQQSLLIYPSVSSALQGLHSGYFLDNTTNLHTCSLLLLDLFDEQHRLRKDLGIDIWNNISALI